MRVLVTGGTGFVGPYVVRAIADAGHEVRVLVRRPGAAKDLPATEVEGDVTDPASLRVAVEGVDAVVHLVAIINGSPEDFERVMSQGTRDLVAAAKEAGVGRFVHMSALGTDESTKDLVPYYRAKWEMERAVKESGIEFVVLRPSFVFGRDGGVLPMFLRQVRYLPATPVVGDGTRRMQPIWVEDLAQYVAASVDLPEAANRTFELGGPDQVTWNELFERIARVLGKRRFRVNVPTGIARAGAVVAERLPGAPVTRDQLTMLEDADNVTDMAPALETFGIAVTPLDEQIRRAA